MTIDPTTKKAALFSSLLHLFALLFLILAVVFANLFAKEEEPFILQMVALPEAAEIVESSVLEPVKKLTVEIPELEPIKLPEPEPEPEPEPVVVRQPPPPIPQPVVVEQPPPPKPKPVVEKPVEKKPPPVPVEKPKPEIISYAEFQKANPIPDRPIPERKPPPKPQPRKIDTSKIEKSLKQISVTELSMTTTSTVADNDAMKNWRALLAARLDALWKQGEVKGTAGKSVRVEFYISAGGSVSSIKVVRSSGIVELDNLGKTTVLRLGSFQPPPSGKGETITVLLKVE